MIYQSQSWCLNQATNFSIHPTRTYTTSQLESSIKRYDGHAIVHAFVSINQSINQSILIYIKQPEPIVARPIYMKKKKSTHNSTTITTQTNEKREKLSRYWNETSAAYIFQRFPQNVGHWHSVYLLFYYNRFPICTNWTCIPNVLPSCFFGCDFDDPKKRPKYEYTIALAVPKKFKKNKSARIWILSTQILLLLTQYDRFSGIYCKMPSKMFVHL